MLLLFISGMPLRSPKNHLRSSRETHKITLYTDKMGSDFLYSYSVPVHLTQNVLNVSPSWPFCWLSNPITELKFKCITCSYFLLKNLVTALRSRKKKKKVEYLLLWYERKFWAIWDFFKQTPRHASERKLGQQGGSGRQGRSHGTAVKGDYSTEALRLISGHTSHSR